MSRVLLVFSGLFVQCFGVNSPLRNTVNNCDFSQNGVSCISEYLAKFIETSNDVDLPIFDGVKLIKKNNSEGILPTGRSGAVGLNRILTAIRNFLNTHTVFVDLTDESVSEEGRGKSGSGIGLGTFGYSRKALRREARYVQYAFMVLLGIFGLTGPFVMKTLAVMAAKALIASKVALIIVGSVALRKIFEKGSQKPSVKVHTITADDDHDRVYAAEKAYAYWTPKAAAYAKSN